VREAARLAGIDVLFSEDLAADIARARLFVYITHEEGLGSAALLAMSAGVPVIASNVGGLREMVSHGATGLLVENSAAEIAAAIRLLYDDEQAAVRMGLAGARVAHDRFSIDRMVDATAAAYREVSRDEG
jgi:glycosyltransferase involved in cell wall biosynthesis